MRVSGGGGVGRRVNLGVFEWGSSIMMSYEKLDVYQCAIQFLSIAVQLCNELPRNHSALTDQIRRASMSIPLNIAEGAGKRTKADCRKFFDIARGSAMECGAAMDVCLILSMIDDKRQKAAKDLLHRIVAMLTKLADA